MTKTGNSRSGRGRIPIVTLGISLSLFFAITLIVCLLLVVILPDPDLHAPWLQFFPWFSWSVTGIVIALIESVVYAWFVAIVFGGIYNAVSARTGQ